MNKLVIFLVLSCMSVAALSQTELKGNPDDLREFLHPSDNIVVIEGYAEQTAFSDRAVVSLVVTTENKLLSVSMSENTNLRSDITSTLVDAGLSADSIKNSQFSSSPQYGWFGRKPDSYKVVNRMAITITDQNQLKEIAVISDQYDEVGMSNTQFEHSQKDEYSNQVKKDALEKIMDQKSFYEEALGVRLVAIGFRDANIAQRGTQGAYALEEVVVTARKNSDSWQGSPASVSQGSATSFDELKYSANLSVNFAIENESN